MSYPPAGRASPGTPPFWQLAVLLALLSFGLAATQVFLRGAPVPVVHDEYSNWFAAQTLALGRLANPSPPEPDAFYAPHILVEPAFVSKYPPAQALGMALGQWLGHPIVGVWLSGVFAALALAYALRARLSLWATGLASAAFVVGALYFSRWIASYWGGLIPFAGGALIMAFALRARSGLPPASAFVALGLGLGVLALSRPFEGLLLALAVAAVHADRILLWLRHSPVRVLRRGLLMLALVTPALLFQALLDRSVSGHWNLMPYQIYHQQYHRLPVFYAGAASAPTRNEPRLQALEDSFLLAPDPFSHVLNGYRYFASAIDEPGGAVLRWFLFAGALAALIASWRLGLVLVAFPALVSIGTYSNFSHYHAAVMPVLFLGLGFLIDGIGSRPRLRRPGLLLWMGVLMTVLVLRHLESGTQQFLNPRSMIERTLATRDPAIVYFDMHGVSPVIDVAYNAPRLDDRVLIVRDLGKESRCRLAGHFPERAGYRMRIQADGQLQATAWNATQECTVGG